MTQLPADMWAEGSAITGSVSSGVTTLDGKPVPEMAESLALGPLGVAGGAAGISPDVVRKGIADLQLVGGTDLGHGSTMAAVAPILETAALSHGDHSDIGAPAAVPQAPGRGGDIGIG